MDEWKQSFKLIYRRSPSPGDVGIAPENLKKEFLKSFGKDDFVPEQKTPVKSEKRGVKRKTITRQADDEFSSPPTKKNTAKKPLLSLKTPDRSIGFSPLKAVRTPSRTSPRKKVTFPEFSLDDDLDSVPVRPAPQQTLSERKVRKMVEFDASPLKPISSDKMNGLTPIKSPKKMQVKRNLCPRNLSSLLLPTPEKSVKKDEFEDAPEFEDETNEDLTAAKAMKIKSDAPKVVKDKENFIKINLRKKTFVRGKVTAEQKRKMKRKHMYKKRFGGK